MQHAPLVIIDDGLGDFGPLTDLRPAFALRNGVLNPRVRIECTLGRMAAALLVRPELKTLQQQRETDAAVNPETTSAIPRTFHERATPEQPWRAVTADDDAPVLFVNGRWTGHDAGTAERIRALEPGAALLDLQGELIACLLQTERANAAWSGGRDLLNEATTNDTVKDCVLLRRPWHVLDHLDATLTHDLRHFPPPGSGPAPTHATVLGDHTVHVHPDSTLKPHVVIDATAGPVALDAGVVVQPFCVIEGPAYLGRHTELAAHTALRSTTAVGASCKLGGEVKASIVGDFTNKAHHGYLGNAVVGHWCNLGAGTTASNLKNTYGQVRMKLHADAATEDTGRQFQGPVVGDYVRTAIGTLLPTGACVGTGSCVIAPGFAPAFIPAMTFLTNNGSAPMDLDAFLVTAERMMDRRNGKPGAALRERFAALLRANH